MNSINKVLIIKYSKCKSFYIILFLIVGRRKVLMSRKRKKILFALVLLLIMFLSIFLLYTQTKSHDLEIESKYMPSETKLQTGMFKQFSILSLFNKPQIRH